MYLNILYKITIQLKNKSDLDKLNLSGFKTEQSPDRKFSYLY